jgi:hypothetical protein
MLCGRLYDCLSANDPHKGIFALREVRCQGKSSQIAKYKTPRCFSCGWSGCIAWKSFPAAIRKNSAKEAGVRRLPGSDCGHVTGMYEDRQFSFAAIPVLATVNYESIAAWYGRDDARYVLPIMLGCVMAHELGHLLLRDPGHSTIGIMQPRLGNEQMRQTLTGRLRFTSQQAKLIREHALTLNTGRESPKLGSGSPGG